jgi:hypothetical protein
MPAAFAVWRADRCDAASGTEAELPATDHGAEISCDMTGLCCEVYAARSTARSLAISVLRSLVALPPQARSLAMIEMKRRLSKQIGPLDDRLVQEAQRLKREVEDMRPGPARDEVLRQARQIEVARHMNEWLNSPGLQPPT